MSAPSTSRSPKRNAQSARTPRSVGKKSKPGSAMGRTSRKSTSRSRSPPKTASSRGASSKSKTSKAGGATGSKPGSSSSSWRARKHSAKYRDSKLQHVDMAGQGMTVIPATFWARRDVGQLNVSSNNLRIIPVEIKKLQTLVMLDLSRNGIRCTHPGDFSGLPAELSQLPNFRVLYLSECNLAFIPPAVWRCRQLEVLDISRNKVNVLPQDIANLEQLRHLNLQQTNLSTLPPEIAFCQQLEELLLWGNIIDSLPDTLKELPNLHTLAINNRCFAATVDTYMENLLRKGQIQSEHIPLVLFEMPALKMMDLEETKNNVLPEYCEANFTEFYLARNFFQTVPEIVFDQNRLTVLDISDNMICDFPIKLADVVTLEVLKLTNNMIGKLPAVIGNLVKLRELSLGGNRLGRLPNEIGKLISLESLILDRNQIESIPETIVQLGELQTLDLTENHLTTLPTKFYRMKKLSAAHSYRKLHKYGLWLHLNPLKTPPENVWKTEDPQQIYSYLRKLEIKTTENLQRQKLILLGESQCGKTSLVRTLSTSKTALTKELDDSTSLIDFQAWRTENFVDFLVYDLGGSDVYKVTHSLFLDPKALYLVVYDHRKYTSQNHHKAIGYWLELIQTYAPGGVVKIVGTQCDLCCDDIVSKTKQVVLEELCKSKTASEQIIEKEIVRIVEKLASENLSKFESEQLKKMKQRLLASQQLPLQIQPEVALVSCGEGVNGIAELQNEIELLAVNRKLFPHAQRYIPSTWHKIKMTIKKTTDRFIKISDLLKIAKKHHIKQQELTECLNFLAETGDILWLKDIPDMQQIILHRPKQIVEILCGLFRHDMIQFLDYANNRIFACRGHMTEESYEQAQEHFLRSGQLSRKFLQCLWFHLGLDNNRFEDLVDFIPKLDLCYAIPQPDLPPNRTHYYPLMVIPFSNTDPHPLDLSRIWPNTVTKPQREMQILLQFPMIYPNGLFEKLACRLQSVVENRLDYQDLIYAEFEDGKVLLSRQLNSQNYDCILSIQVRSSSMRCMNESVARIYKQLESLLNQYPGIVWYTQIKGKNIASKTLHEWYPKANK